MRHATPVLVARVLRTMPIALAGLLSAGPTSLFAQGGSPTAPAASAPSAASQVAQPVVPKEPPALSDVVVAAARADAMRRQVETALGTGQDEGAALSSALGDVESRIETGMGMIRSGEFSRLRYDTLVDIDGRIRDRERDIGDATRRLGARLAQLERDIDRLERELAAWPERLRAAEERKAPAAILDRAKAVGPELAATRDEVRKRRDELLLAFDRGTRVLGHLDTLRAAVAGRRDAIGRQLRSAEEAPIWKSTTHPEDHGAVRAEFAMARQMLVDYLRSEGAALALGLAAIALTIATLLRRTGVPRSEAPAAVRPSRLDAFAAGLLVALVTLAFAAPTGPTAFYPLWWFPAPLVAAWVAHRLLDVKAMATLWALAAVGSVNTFNTIAELQPGVERLLLVAQALLLGAAVAYDWSRGALDRQFSRWHPITVRALVIAMLLTLAASVVCALVGLVGVARMLRGAAITATAAAMVFAVTAAVLERALAAALSTPIVQRLRGVREEEEAVRRFLTAVVRLAAAVGWVLLLVYTQNMVDWARGTVDALAKAKISVRDVDVSAGGVLLAVLIVLATAVAIRFVRFLLNVEILPRFGLRPGVPFAIATIAGYVVAVIGFVLALAALGVDLTKVTLLAGALGIGIGFGLQNIVNNFVSGLILVLERPVKVGDQVAIGDLLGDVRRIGIRSSTVRTVQGAEVIVPNSDLVSKQVVNWTLSDRSRRYEIDVGVAYGTDVDRVMKLLEDAAAKVPEVKKIPAPRVLFAGFGDSSLDFRVLAWAESVDVGLQAQNNLRRAILAALNAAGIEIPYPQRDVHVRASAPPAGAPGIVTDPG
jgi:small-conductance mechanosensitive channel